MQCCSISHHWKILFVVEPLVLISTLMIHFICVHRELPLINYVDGLSVTHGSPRQHVWTFAAGNPCPCRNPYFVTPSSVGSNYFCENDRDGQLWDGISCSIGCCTFNSPPWFIVSVPAPSSDDIEVRLCTDQLRDDEAVHIRFYQFYIQ